MNRRVLPFIVGSLLLPLGCGLTDPPLVLQPSELCSDNPDDAIATFEDAQLEDAIRKRANSNEGPVGFLETRDRIDLTCGLISGLRLLQATPADPSSGGFESLVGIQNLTGLEELHLAFNSITDISLLNGLTGLWFLGLYDNPISDISALSGLGSLRFLDLGDNLFTDISPLSGLTSLTNLGLSINSITDVSALSGLTGLYDLNLDDNPGLSNIQSLLDNTGLGADDRVFLRNTNVSCTDVALLEAKGVIVQSDCP